MSVHYLLCVACNRQIPLERSELGYVKCVNCADQDHDLIRPRGIIHSTSSEGDHEVEIVTAEQFIRAQKSFYEPQIFTSHNARDPEDPT